MYAVWTFCPKLIIESPNFGIVSITPQRDSLYVKITSELTTVASFVAINSS